MTNPDITCGGLDDRLADYLEGTLAPAPRRAVEAHLAGCPRCAALVTELRDLTVQAAALPELAPSRDLWGGIAGRIEAPVIPLAAAPRATTSTWRRHGWMGVAAAALVAVTAGVTYTITMSRVGSGTASVAEADPTVVPSPTVRPPATTTQPAQDVAVAPESASTTTVAATPATTRDASPARERAAESPVRTREPVSARTPSRVVSELEQATVGYDEEIGRLRSLLNERRGQLDPRTAAVLESSIRTIDDAIAQSRAALESDPASRFLVEQLNKTLEKKVELLRTAVLLPGRA